MPFTPVMSSESESIEGGGGGGERARFAVGEGDDAVLAALLLGERDFKRWFDGVLLCERVCGAEIVRGGAESCSGSVRG